MATEEQFPKIVFSFFEMLQYTNTKTLCCRTTSRLSEVSRRIFDNRFNVAVSCSDQLSCVSLARRLFDLFKTKNWSLATLEVSPCVLVGDLRGKLAVPRKLLLSNASDALTKHFDSIGMLLFRLLSRYLDCAASRKW